MDNITDSGLRRRVKMHVSAKEHVYFAVVQPGFEQTLSEEMKSLGLGVCGEFIEGGVEFAGRTDDLYKACLSLRGASRIVMRLGTFRSDSFIRFEKEITDFPWELYMPWGAYLQFRTSASKSMIWHTGKMEGIISRCIASRMSQHSKREYFHSQADGMPQTLIIRNYRDRCAISLDASGQFLHRRTGEKHIAAAPLRETTAALILLEAGIRGYEVLVDPMCGSGTFSLEAAGIYSGALPAAERDFPFFGWPCFKRNHFEYLKRTIAGEDGPLSGRSIITCDIDPKAVEIARHNVHDVLRNFVLPEVKDFFDLQSDIADGKRALLVLNPPYGKRIENGSTVRLYEKIGRKLRGDFTGCGFAVIVPGVEAEQALACGYDRKVLFMNGGLKVAVLFRDAPEL